jgi:microcystin degradation protein MlrC
VATIAIAGMQHETNTFAPSKADYEAFVSGGGFPSIQHGEAVLDAIDGANLPAQGAVTALRGAGHAVIPIAWAAASPSAHVTDDAFERIVGSIVDGLSRARDINGVYLDLHGAMVTETYDDGEGEILRRVRSVVGPRVPVVVSLDLHANITQRMVDIADAISIYRTYPHVDMAETGARAAGMLLELMRTQQAFEKAFHQFDYLTGLPSQSTFIEPARLLYSRLEQIEAQTGTHLSFAMGFPMADIADCGMSVLGYGARGSVDVSLQQLVNEIEEAEKHFTMKLYEPEDAVRYAMNIGEPGHPVVIADTQDNPGAGGNGDTPGLLAAMLRVDAQDAVIGMIIDPASAQRAHQVGENMAANFELGAISGLPGHEPVCEQFTVERLGDGQFTCTGPMFNGIRMKLGPMALLRCRGVRVVLASEKCQAADQEMFRHLGLEPSTQRMVGLKSSVHFRAAFQPIAREVIVTAAPGPSLANPEDFAWTQLRSGVRLNPMGNPFKP